MSKKLHILCIDDEPDLVEVMEFFLRNIGYQVTTETASAAALALIEQQHFDYILSDIKMPMIDGVELAKRIRALGINTPIALITAFSDFDNSDLTRFGIEKVFSKPHDFDAIAHHLSQRLAPVALAEK